MFLREPFEEKDIDKIISFIKSQNFATLVSTGANSSPIASHLPLDVIDDPRAKLGVKMITHMAIGNPHLPLLAEGQEVMVIFLSNSNYISPSWFADQKSAPTQSHIAVHVYGKVRIVSEPDELLKMMTHQVDTREKSMNGNWKIDNLGKSGIESRLSKISGVEINIDRVEASFRLLQDESKENIQGVLASGSLDADTRSKIQGENNVS